MALTTKANTIIPEVFTEAVQAAFANKNAFMGSLPVQFGAVSISGTMPAGAGNIGETISIPYLSSLGEFEDIVTDGTAATAVAISTTKESATVAHAALGFDVTRWARMNSIVDLYSNAAQQVVQSAQRKMDASIVVAAAATGGLGLDKYSSVTPHTLSYDDVVDARQLWGDQQGGVCCMMVHSKVLGDLAKLKDTTGRPLLNWELSQGMMSQGMMEPIPYFYGIPVSVSDALPISGGSISAVTSSGTSPPVITLTGTPTMPVNLRVECTTGGARGTWVLRYSIDGGVNWTSAVTSAATILMYHHASGFSTGITLNIATGNATNDNVWTANTILKHTSIICKRGALAFWYNQEALGLQTIQVPSVDSMQGFVHLYYAAYRYKHLNGSRFPGVVVITHN